MLVEFSVVEQRYAAVREVLDDGATVTDVARRNGVTRQTVHEWLRNYAAGGWIDPNNFGRILERVARDAGVPRLTPKGLRHTHVGRHHMGVQVRVTFARGAVPERRRDELPVPLGAHAVLAPASPTRRPFHEVEAASTASSLQSGTSRLSCGSGAVPELVGLAAGSAIIDDRQAYRRPDWTYADVPASIDRSRPTPA